MKTPRWFLPLLLVASTVPVVAAETPETKSAASPYTILESFAGGTWVASVPVPQGAAPLKLELQFAWAENKQGLRFHSEFVQGEKRRPYTSGIYAWNGAKGKLVIFYTDSSASLTEGPITVEDNVLVHELTATDAKGGVEPVRVRLNKLGTDAFLNQIYLQKNGAWEKFVEVKYERHQ